MKKGKKMKKVKRFLMFLKCLGIACSIIWGAVALLTFCLLICHNRDINESLLISVFYGIFGAVAFACLVIVVGIIACVSSKRRF